MVTYLTIGVVLLVCGAAAATVGAALEVALKNNRLAAYLAIVAVACLVAGVIVGAEVGGIN